MSTHHRNHSSPNITLHFDGGTGGPNLELDGLMIYAPNDDTSTPPISCTGPALKYRDLRESRDAMRAQLSASPTPHEDISHDASRFLYNKVVLTQVPGDPVVSPETIEVCKLVTEALQLRTKYLFVPDNVYGAFRMNAPPTNFLNPKLNINAPNPYSPDSPEASLGSSPLVRRPLVPLEQETFLGPSDMIVERHPIEGVWFVYADQAAKEAQQPKFAMPTFSEYIVDLDRLMHIVSYGPSKSFCFQRLKLLESKFSLYSIQNEAREAQAQKAVPHRDFYNIRKVDVHVHHSSCMNSKHLLRFIKHKLRHNPDEVVIFRDGRNLTLKEVFESLHLTAYDLSIDTLDMHADNRTFHRFDRFNLKYNPCGQSRLREIFLKTNNMIKGRYFAELTREVCADLEDSKYQYAEYRISIYGRSEQEWDQLASWLIDNTLFSPHVRWLIQVPRLFDVYKASNEPGIETFGDLLSNIFDPLFRVTHDPSSNPKLAKLLEYIVGFDCVDDESRPEGRLYQAMPRPHQWDSPKNPPYTYYSYYLYASLYQLNCMRQARGMSMLSFRPHSGEAGDPTHLASSFMCAQSINHGINLRKAPALEYIYYLTQIGLGMSPLSNNALFLNISRNPFPTFFARGLNVTLSTDDPLQFHFSKEAIIEEYSVARSVWKLSSADLSEVARNSVLQSGFEHDLKVAWLGHNYWKFDVTRNDINRTNIPDCREAFRMDNLREELAFIAEHCKRE